MKKLKIVQIGTGHDHALAPIDFLKERDDIDFLGYVRVENDSLSFDGVKELSLNEVLNIKDLDAVFIETEDKYLTKYAYEFVKRGIAVQMDKPGGQNKKCFDALFDLAEKNKVPLHLGYMYRYNPALKKIIKTVKSGELGKIYYSEMHMSCHHSDKKRRWLKDYKGGMMNFLGCHLVDLLLQIQGVPDEILPFNSANGKDSGEDIGFAVFRYGNNASFIRSAGLEAGGFKRRNIVVVGEKGTMEIRPTEHYIEEGLISDLYITMIDKNNTDLNGGKTEKITFGPYDRYYEMYDEFIRIVRGEIENPYSYEYEKQLHDILLKACGIS